MGVVEIVVSTGGGLLIAFLAWFFFGPKGARRAEVRGGVQEVEITVKGGYSPNVIEVREGVPVKLTFDRQEASDCTARVVFPDFAVSKSLPAFARTSVEFVPEREGRFGFACGMNMVHGTLVVVPQDGDGAGPREGAETSAEDAVDGHGHEVARAVGVGPTRDVGEASEVEFRILGEGVTCPTCVRNIHSILNGLDGIDRVEVNFAAERVTVGFDPDQTSAEEMREAIASGGYQVKERPEPGSEATEDEEAATRQTEIQDLSRRVAVGAVLTAPVLFGAMVGEFLDPDWLPAILVDRWLQLALIAPVMFYTGWPIHRTGWLVLRRPGGCARARKRPGV